MTGEYFWGGAFEPMTRGYKFRIAMPMMDTEVESELLFIYT